MIVLNECDSISLVTEDGEEVTITMVRDAGGAVFVSLYIDDGFNVSQLSIPRYVFDRLISEMRTMQ